MTQDEIVELAKQHDVPVELFAHPAVKKLVHVVAKQVEARYMQLFLDPENQPTQFGTATEQYREQEINDEAEICSEIVLEKIKQYDSLHFTHLRFVLNDIYFKMKTRYES